MQTTSDKNDNEETNKQIISEMVEDYQLSESDHKFLNRNSDFWISLDNQFYDQEEKGKPIPGFFHSIPVFLIFTLSFYIGLAPIAIFSFFGALLGFTIKAFIALTYAYLTDSNAIKLEF